MDRIRNLEILADLWGKIYLFHPNVVRDDLRIQWDRVLAKAIPNVENAASEDELISKLNKWLFEPLRDPHSFAEHYEATENSQEDESDSSIVFDLKGEKVGYIAIPHPQIIRDPDFLDKFASAHKEISKANQIIVDLRWQVIEERPYGFEPLFMFFIEEAISAAHAISRSHYGWSQFNDHSVYDQRWEITVGKTLRPITQPNFLVKFIYRSSDFDQFHTIKKPTVFVVNNSSYSCLAHLLVGIQALSHVAVIWERTGSFGTLGWSTSWNPIRYEEDIQANISQSLLISNQGAFGFKAERTEDSAIEEKDLHALATKALAEKNRASADTAAQLSFDMNLGEQDPVSSDDLSREDRLLGLFRMFSIIGYFFPHLADAGIEWKSLLRSAIPRIEDAGSLREYYSELQEIAAQLNDSHIRVWHPEMHPGEYTIAYRFAKVDGTLLVAQRLDTNESEDLVLGDEILEIEGTPIDKFEKTWRARTSVSTDQAFYRRLYDLRGLGTIPTAAVPFRGEKDSKLTLRRKRDQEAHEVSLSRSIQAEAWNDASIGTTPKAILEGDIGHINLLELPDLAVLDSALASVQGTKGLILDLRGYPRFWLTLDLVSRLCNSPVHGTIFEKPVVSSYDPVQRAWSREQLVVQPHSKINYAKPVVVLIDERTQSMPEDLCIYLKNASRVKFVGSPTTGTNGDVTLIHLPGGGDMSFTGTEVKFGDGSKFQSIGITPDLEVYPTIDGIREGRDEILEAAKEFLKELL